MVGKKIPVREKKKKKITNFWHKTLFRDMENYSTNFLLPVDRVYSSQLINDITISFPSIN